MAHTETPQARRSEPTNNANCVPRAQSHTPAKTDFRSTRSNGKATRFVEAMKVGSHRTRGPALLARSDFLRIARRCIFFMKAKTFEPGSNSRASQRGSALLQARDASSSALEDRLPEKTYCSAPPHPLVAVPRPNPLVACRLQQRGYIELSTEALTFHWVVGRPTGYTALPLPCTASLR